MNSNPTADLQELESQKLDLERERFEFEKHSRSLEAQSVWRPHFGVILTAIVSSLAVLITAAQIITTQISKSSELEITRFRADKEDERQWRVALLQFLSDHQASFFSKNLEEREQVMAMLEVSFPSRYAGPVRNKITILRQPDQDFTVAATRKLVFDDLLEPLIAQLNKSKTAFEHWDARTIHDCNVEARRLLLYKAYLIPPDLRSDALRLVEHYDAWLGEFEHIQSSRDGNLNMPFGSPQFPFPKDAENHFREAYQQYAKYLHPT